MEELDRAGDPNYRSDDPVIRDGSLGHANRMWTTPSKELVAATKGDPPWARHLTSHTEQVRLLIRAEKVATAVALRMTSSPQENEKPGKSGAGPIMAAVQRGLPEFQRYVQTMPCSSRGPRMVTNRDVLSDAIPYVAYMLARERSAPTLKALRQEVTRHFLEYQKRKLDFHALQIACDLMGLGLVEVEDSTDCPTSIGSKRGLKRVHEYDRSATVRRPAHRFGCSPPAWWLSGSDGRRCRTASGTVTSSFSA